MQPLANTRPNTLRLHLLLLVTSLQLEDSPPQISPTCLLSHQRGQDSGPCLFQSCWSLKGNIPPPHWTIRPSLPVPHTSVLITHPTIKVWPEGTDAVLQDQFINTDWNKFTHKDLDQYGQDHYRQRHHPETDHHVPQPEALDEPGCSSPAEDLQHRLQVSGCTGLEYSQG